jgi:hypothetical protein
LILENENFHKVEINVFQKQLTIKDEVSKKILSIAIHAFEIIFSSEQDIEVV